MSSTIASSILRKFSACRSSLDENGMALILVTPSTRCATSGPNSSSMRSMVVSVSSTTSWSRPATMAAGVELHVGEDVGDLERVDQVGLPRLAHLALVREGREDVGPPEQLDVGVRHVASDLVDQVFESNHGDRCLRARRARPLPGFIIGTGSRGVKAGRRRVA